MNSEQDPLRAMQAVLDLVGVGILVFVDERIVYANPLFIRKVGLGFDDICNISLHEFEGGTWAVLIRGESWTDALPWTTPKGLLWFEVTLCQVQWGDRSAQVATCVDVTSRMRVEDAEAKTLQMVSEVIAGNPAGSFVIDAESRVVYWNRACEALTGMVASELIGTTEAWRPFYVQPTEVLADSVMKPDAEARIRRRYRSVWKSTFSEDGYEVEHYFPRLGQDGRWLHFAATPLRDADGKIIGAIQTMFDISERVAVEQMLAETIDNAPVGMFVLNADHVVTHWNRVCEAVSGLSAASMVGTKDAWRSAYDHPRPILADFIIDGDSFASIQRFYSDGRCRPASGIEGAYQIEGFFQKLAGGAGAWLLLTAAPLRNSNGKIVGAIQTIQDITGRRYAEEELRTAHLEAERLVAQRTRELEIAKSALELDVAHRKFIEIEMQRRLREVTELNGQLHDTQDKLMRSQEQLVQNEKLASIGQLAAGVAHEINNPIGYVHSNVGTLQTYIGDLLKLIDAYVSCESDISNESARNAVASLRKTVDLDYLKGDVLDLMSESREGIERVRKIVQDLKDFSHVDASSDWQWVDLRRGLESTLNVVNNEIKYKADVVREFAELPQIQCMPSQLNQVFMNLLVNAAHAIKDDTRGKITVATGVKENAVWVEVRDNGCGMNEEVKGRIFDPFFTTKPIGKGTGLGLSLSYGIVKKHNGSIQVQSTPGEGTVFRIVLPIAQPEAVVADAVPPAPAA